jgi:hypothetical protein
MLEMEAENEPPLGSDESMADNCALTSSAALVRIACANKQTSAEE